MYRFVRTAALVAALGGVGLTAAGCGGSSSGGSGGGSTAKAPLVVGMTYPLGPLDPAFGITLGDGILGHQIFQTLLWVPPGSSEPQPQVADKCEFSDPKTYTCTLKADQKFSNGDSLTAQDVKFSIDRVVSIDDPDAGAYLFEPLKSIDAPDDQTVTFNLKRPTGTWPSVLATFTASILPSDVFPADEELDSSKVIGSGPYQIGKLELGKIAALTPNASYAGPEPENGGITFVSYQTPSAMRQAIQQGEVDAAFGSRSFNAQDLQSFESNDDLEVVGIQGIDGRYLVLNSTVPPLDNPAVRKAIAYSIDRESIAENVWDGLVRPLHSVVPQGVTGATSAFQDEYGSAPDTSKAEELLESAGVSTPIPITLWYMPTYWGANAQDEWLELSRQLNSTGLFKVDIKSSETNQYFSDTGMTTYPAYMAGWLPDFVDADNYVEGFTSAWVPQIEKSADATSLIQEEQGSTDPAIREGIFAEIQQSYARDAIYVPIYQGDITIVLQKGVEGVDESSVSSTMTVMNLDRWHKD